MRRPRENPTTISEHFASTHDSLDNTGSSADIYRQAYSADNCQGRTISGASIDDRLKGLTIEVVITEVDYYGERAKVAVTSLKIPEESQIPAGPKGAALRKAIINHIFVLNKGQDYDEADIVEAIQDYLMELERGDQMKIEAADMKRFVSYLDRGAKLQPTQYGFLIEKFVKDQELAENLRRIKIEINELITEFSRDGIKEQNEWTRFLERRLGAEKVRILVRAQQVFFEGYHEYFPTESRDQVDLKFFKMLGVS